MPLIAFFNVFEFQFFERKDDGTMKRSILGWGDGEGLRVLIPNLEDEGDDDDDPIHADMGM